MITDEVRSSTSSTPIERAGGLDELGFLRITLEAQLARRAANRMTPDVLSALTQVDQQLNLAIARGDIGDYLKRNYLFHATINQTADAPIISATVDQLWLRFGPSLRVVCGRIGTSNLPDKHAELLAAFTQSDPDAAALAMQGDVEQGMQHIRTSFENGGGLLDSIDTA